MKSRMSLFWGKLELRYLAAPVEYMVLERCGGKNARAARNARLHLVGRFVIREVQYLGFEGKRQEPQDDAPWRRRSVDSRKKARS